MARTRASSGKRKQKQSVTDTESDSEDNLTLFARFKNMKEVRGKTAIKSNKRREPLSVDSIDMKNMKRASMDFTEDGVENRDIKRKKARIENSNKSKIKDWDLVLGNVKFFGGKIVSSNDYTVIEDIKPLLSTEQLDIMRKGSFGKFLELPDSKLQYQLVHMLLFREVLQPRTDELWVDLSGKILRFGIEEFSIVTGMKCNGQCNRITFEHVRGGLFDKYFAGLGSLTRQVIEHRFKLQSWRNDEDAVKLASLHLLANFLMGAQSTLLFDRSYLDILDSPRCYDYPWGKEVFDFTIRHLKGNLCGKEKQAREKHEKGKGHHVFYRLRGLVMALQSWFYECCADSCGILCVRMNGGGIPRMLKWKAAESFDSEFMRRTFLNRSPDKFCNITPTSEELQVLDLGGFFSGKNQFMRAELRSTSPAKLSTTDDVWKRLEEMSQKQATMGDDLRLVKDLLHEFSTKVFSELECIKKKFEDFSTVGKVGTDYAENVRPQPENNSGKGIVSGNVVSGGSSSVEKDVDDDGNFALSTQLFDELVRSAEAHCRKKERISTVVCLDKSAPRGHAVNGASSSFALNSTTEADLVVGAEEQLILTSPSFAAIMHGIVESPQKVDKNNALVVFGSDKGIVDDHRPPDIGGVGQNAMGNVLDANKVVSADGDEEELTDVPAKVDDKSSLVVHNASGSGSAVRLRKTTRTRRCSSKVSEPYLIVHRSSEFHVKRAKPGYRNLKKNILSDSCPFDTDFWEDDEDYLKAEDFELFLEQGLLKHPRATQSGVIYYQKKYAVLNPGFDFNVEEITDKSWFLTLDQPGQFFSCSHIDVIFYYLRKLGFYSESEVAVHFTTTDTFFAKTIQNLYSVYVANSAELHVLNVHNAIVDYIMGFRMICGWPWVEVDHILFPIPIDHEEIGHWILGRLSIPDRILYVYNSVRTEANDKFVVNAVKCFSTLIPIFLQKLKFYERRKESSIRSERTVGKVTSDPFEVVLIQGLPVHTRGDCGVYVASFAEYFISGYEIDVTHFDADLHRKRIATVLYNHGNFKLTNGYESDDEPAGMLPDDLRKDLFRHWGG